MTESSPTPACYCEHVIVDSPENRAKLAARQQDPNSTFLLFVDQHNVEHRFTYEQFLERMAPTAPNRAAA